MQLYSDEKKYMAQMHELWEEMDGCTVLISGATGMVGKCLVETIILHNNYTENPIRIVALSRNERNARERLEDCFEDERFDYMSCDVNEGLPDLGQIDYVIHAASNTHPLQYSQDPVGTITTNVIGTKNLLDYAVMHGAKCFCFVSSVEVYGENRGDVEKFDENYLGYLNCNTLRAGYPESKRLGETLCNAYKQMYGLEFVIPRLSRVYGPTMLSTDTKALSQFIRKAASAEDIVLKSEGIQKYSYSFVTDAVYGLLYVLRFGERGRAYNVANEESDVLLKDLAQIMADISRKKVVFEIPDDVERRGYSTATKAMLDVTALKELGWKARVNLREGLECAVVGVKKQMKKEGVN